MWSVDVGGNKLEVDMEGLYRSCSSMGKGLYNLEIIFGESIPRTWNSKNLKKYYS